MFFRLAFVCFSLKFHSGPFGIECTFHACSFCAKHDSPSQHAPPLSEKKAYPKTTKKRRVRPRSLSTRSSTLPAGCPNGLSFSHILQQRKLSLRLDPSWHQVGSKLASKLATSWLPSWLQAGPMLWSFLSFAAMAETEIAGRRLLPSPEGLQ